MSIPGSAVHQQLMDLYAEFQAELEAERTVIGQARNQHHNLQEERSAALVDLAEHYLPELSREAIANTWNEIQPDVESLILRKEDHQRRLQSELAELSSKHDRQQQRLMENRSQLDQATEQQQHIATEVEAVLRDDQAFVELSDRAAIAEAALERAEANLAEIDQDAARKLPAYQQSQLFRYLYQRGFGSDAYRYRGFTRQMDRSLAKFIGYQKARAGYEFLKNTPDQMRKVIAQDRAALDTVMDELELRRDSVAQQFGLAQAIEKSQSLSAQRQDLLTDLNRLSDQIQQTQQESDQVTDNRGTYYQEAIELFRELLEKTGSQALNQHAQATPDPTDDQIVARLLGVESEIDGLHDQTHQRRKELDDEREFLAGIGRVIQRFRAAQFDSSRSFFVGSLNLAEEIRQARQFEGSNYLWKRLRNAQRWGDPGSSTNATASDPMAQVLSNAMGQAASGDHQNHALRASQRRASRG